MILFCVLKELGKYCIDLSKLVFGGIILAGIMDLDISRIMLFGIGTCITILTAIAGFICILLSENKN